MPSNSNVLSFEAHPHAYFAADMLVASCDSMVSCLRGSLCTAPGCLPLHLSLRSVQLRGAVHAGHAGRGQRGHSLWQGHSAGFGFGALCGLAPRPSLEEFLFSALLFLQSSHAAIRPQPRFFPPVGVTWPERVIARVIMRCCDASRMPTRFGHFALKGFSEKPQEIVACQLHSWRGSSHSWHPGQSGNVLSVPAMWL